MRIDMFVRVSCVDNILQIRRRGPVVKSKNKVPDLII